jgi:hypothetical protein
VALTARLAQQRLQTSRLAQQRLQTSRAAPPKSFLPFRSFFPTPLSKPILTFFFFHCSFYLSFFLSLLTLNYIGARGGKRIQIYDHTSQFLLLNTFLSIAYFAWGGVINLLCMPWPNTLVAEGRIH